MTGEREVKTYLTKDGKIELEDYLSLLQIAEYKLMGYHMYIDMYGGLRFVLSVGNNYQPFKFHRHDGPAVRKCNGAMRHYLYGFRVTPETHEECKDMPEEEFIDWGRDNVY